jgi:hypothetical protein
MAEDQAKTKHGVAIQEKIETKAASPPEIFEAKLTSLVDRVLKREMMPVAAVHELHSFWMAEFTSEERDLMIHPDTVGNVLEAGNRLMLAGNLIGNEMPVLIAAHNTSKGF